MLLCNTSLAIPDTNPSDPKLPAPKTVLSYLVPALAPPQSESQRRRENELDDIARYFWTKVTEP